MMQRVVLAKIHQAIGWRRSCECTADVPLWASKMSGTWTWSVMLAGMVSMSAWWVLLTAGTTTLAAIHQHNRWGPRSLSLLGKSSVTLLWNVFWQKGAVCVCQDTGCSKHCRTRSSCSPTTHSLWPAFWPPRKWKLPLNQCRLMRPELLLDILWEMWKKWWRRVHCCKSAVTGKVAHACDWDGPGHCRNGMRSILDGDWSCNDSLLLGPIP